MKIVTIALFSVLLLGQGCTSVEFKPAGVSLKKADQTPSIVYVNDNVGNKSKTKAPVDDSHRHSATRILWLVVVAKLVYDHVILPDKLDRKIEAASR